MQFDPEINDIELQNNRNQQQNRNRNNDVIVEEDRQITEIDYEE